MKNLKNMPEDLIPYWDMSAPNIPNEPRDVSTASCIASALYEISTMDVPDAAGYKMSVSYTHLDVYKRQSFDYISVQLIALTDC